MELFGPAMLADPYAAYAELRERDPVYWSERLGAWVLTRDADVRAVLLWCNDFLLPFGRDVRTLSADELVAVRAAAQGLSGFVTTVLERHRQADEDDVIGRLVAGEADDRLSREELFANIVLLLIAGHENSSSLIANGAVWLIDLPDVRELLTGDASRWPDTVDELLRLVTPNQFIRRKARGTTVIGERTVRAGDAVLLVLAAANRDPARFADPDVFVLDRPGRQDVALGHGFHYCLGAPLARLEARIALQTLFTRYPALARFDDPLQYVENFNVRLLRALPVRTC